MKLSTLKPPYTHKNIQHHIYPPLPFTHLHTHTTRMCPLNIHKKNIYIFICCPTVFLAIPRDYQTIYIFIYIFLESGIFVEIYIFDNNLSYIEYWIKTHSANCNFLHIYIYYIVVVCYVVCVCELCALWNNTTLTAWIFYCFFLFYIFCVFWRVPVMKMISITAMEWY